MKQFYKTSKYLIVFLIIFTITNCNQKVKNEEIKPEYPKYIVEHNLEYQFDKAKWLLYKLNCVENSWNGKIDYLINIEDWKLMMPKYSKIRDQYYSEGKNIHKDESKIIEIFGKENFARYIELNLEWFHEKDIDKSDLIRKDTISLVFFPKPIEREPKYYQKLSGGLIYEIVFKGDSIINIGQDDYVLWNYNSRVEEGELSDENFISLIKKSDYKVNKWLENYAKKLDDDKNKDK